MPDRPLGGDPVVLADVDDPGGAVAQAAVQAFGVRVVLGDTDRHLVPAGPRCEGLRTGDQGAAHALSAVLVTDLQVVQFHRLWVRGPGVGPDAPTPRQYTGAQWLLIPPCDQVGGLAGQLAGMVCLVDTTGSPPARAQHAQVRGGAGANIHSPIQQDASGRGSSCATLRIPFSA
jgi:hypothetical protein